VGTYDNGIDSVWEPHPIELTGERLFVPMGMSKYAHAEYRPVRGEDFKPS
jgi:hypothetical protein